MVRDGCFAWLAFGVVTWFRRSRSSLRCGASTAFAAVARRLATAQTFVARQPRQATATSGDGHVERLTHQRSHPHGGGTAQQHPNGRAERRGTPEAATECAQRAEAHQGADDHGRHP